MLQKSLNSIEVIACLFLLALLRNFYDPVMSYHREFDDAKSLRLVLDVTIGILLILRILAIIFGKYLSSLGLSKWTLLIRLLLVIALIPDLIGWFKWCFFANMYMYLQVFIPYAIPFAFLLLKGLMSIKKVRAKV